MEYKALPIGDIWSDGVFCVPNRIASSYIKMASEYQLKALMIILSKGGCALTKDISKILGCTESDADDFLDFWVEEGILTKDDYTPVPITPAKPRKPENTPAKSEIVKEVKAKKALETMPIPTLSPKDIITICRENQNLTELLRSAQEVLGKTLSHAEQELIINMVNYYGLPEEIVLTILHYYKTQKELGRVRGTVYIATMAKNWAEEGITTLSAADEKLKDIEDSDKAWVNIVEMSGIRHRNPTVKQREMIKRWTADFSMEMIGIACDTMKENADKPTLNYVDGILKNWKKKGIATPSDVEADNQKHTKAVQTEKAKADDGIDETYDLDEITKRAMFNDNFDI